jgi:hypothetical protein
MHCSRMIEELLATEFSSILDHITHDVQNTIDLQHDNTREIHLRMSTVSQQVMNCILEPGLFSLPTYISIPFAFLSEYFLHPDKIFELSGLHFFTLLHHKSLLISDLFTDAQLLRFGLHSIV